MSGHKNYTHSKPKCFYPFRSSLLRSIWGWSPLLPSVFLHWGALLNEFFSTEGTHRNIGLFYNPKTDSGPSYVTCATSSLLAPSPPIDQQYNTIGNWLAPWKLEIHLRYKISIGITKGSAILPKITALYIM